MRYGSVRKPHYRILGRTKKLSKADEEALFEYLLHEGWRQQDEIKYWLWHEREVDIHQSTISRLFRDANGQGSNLSAFPSTEAKFYAVVILMISVNLQRRILSS